MQQPRWQLRRSAIRRLSAAPSPNKDLPVNRRNVTREFKIPQLWRRRKCRLKVNLRPYDHVVIISTRLLLSNAGELFWSRIPSNHIQVQKEIKRKFRRHLFTSSIKREMKLFHVVVVQWWQKNVQKKAWRTCRVVVCLSNLLPFWRFRCCRRRCILDSLLYLYLGAFIRRQTIKSYGVNAYTW